MNAPNVPDILMFHRVRLAGNQDINRLYYDCGMVCGIDDVCAAADGYLRQGKTFGSISQCAAGGNCFHLSFDDGFKEHLATARFLKDKYDMPCDGISFSVCVNNSANRIYSGMDVVYELMRQDKKHQLCRFLDLPPDSAIDAIKKKLSSSDGGLFAELNIQFHSELRVLENVFLDEHGILELSHIAQVNSHGMFHRFLTFHESDSLREISESKRILETIVKKPVETFCYPEGKNDRQTRRACGRAGYKNALSISHSNGDPYRIGRKTIP